MITNNVRPKSGDRSGFTLIELLVVIAIIAILAAILFPVFAKVREKARQITCISNEKQMALGVIQYIQDNDEHYPLLQYYIPATYDWYAEVIPYIKNGSDDDVGGVDYNYGQGGIWNCPDFPQDKTGIGAGLPFSEYGMIRGLAGEPGNNIPAASLADVDQPASQAMIIEHGAAWYTPWGGADQNNWPYIEVQESAWTAPIGCPTACNPKLDTQLALQYDIDTTAANSPATPAWNGPGDFPRYRHTNTTNVVFNDGHAKSVVRGQLNWYNNIYIAVPYARLYGTPD